MILSAVSTTEARGTSVVDESLLEEASMYSFFEPHSLLSFGDRGSPFSSYSGGDKAMVVVGQGLGMLDGPAVEVGEAVIDPLRVI